MTESGATNMARRTGLVVSLLVTMSLGVSGCSDGDGSAQTVSAPDTAAETTQSRQGSSTTSSESASSEEPSSSAEVSATQPPKPANLEEVLIPLESMPSGWSVGPAEQRFTDDTGEECENVLTGFVDESDDIVEVNYLQSTPFPFMTQAAMQFDSSGEAKAFVEATADVREKCNNYQNTSDVGTLQTVTVLPLSFDQYGDQIRAVHVQVDSEFFLISGDVVLIRDDDIVTVLVHAGLGDIDSELTAELAAEAEQLLDQAT